MIMTILMIFFSFMAGMMATVLVIIHALAKVRDRLNEQDQRILDSLNQKINSRREDRERLAEDERSEYREQNLNFKDKDDNNQ